MAYSREDIEKAAQIARHLTKSDDDKERKKWKDAQKDEELAVFLSGQLVLAIQREDRELPPNGKRKRAIVNRALELAKEKMAQNLRGAK